MTDCAIWVRVSTADQNTENQLGLLRQWATRRGLNIVTEHLIEDSAWSTTGGAGGKGKEFDKHRAELLNGARLGHYSVVLVWALDRLSRRGMEDTLSVLRQLAECGTDVWSHEEPWLRTADAAMRELLVGLAAWMAKQESLRRSERTKAGIERRRKAGLPVGGRKPGAKDRKPRQTEGYVAEQARRWADNRAARGKA